MLDTQLLRGYPTTLDEMTQIQLRAFIPLMLKHATGHGKPGWDNQARRPPWWPKNIPWANVKTDPRSDAEKDKVRT